MSTTTPALRSRLGAEALGTFILVFGGCGSVIFFGSADRVAVALAFGLSVIAGAYAFGHVSGAHFNTAVTVGLATAKRFPWRDVPAYLLAQLAGASAAGAALYGIASGHDGFVARGHMATNGYGNDGYSLGAVLAIEALLTAIFVLVILGVTSSAAMTGFAGLAIGLTLTLIHLIAIPVDGTSVNPARSLGVAWFDSVALGQVWVFIAAPIVGAIAGAIVHRVVVE